MSDYAQKVVVVTGAASGIGRGIAEAAAARGVRKLVLADINRAELNTVCEDLRATGAEVLAVPTDVTELSQVEALRDAAIEAFGALHYVFNNAGILANGTVWELSDSDWERVMKVNFNGVLNGVRTFVPALLAQRDDAWVINTASIGGLITGPRMGPYGASKFAVVGLGQQLYYELAELGAGLKTALLCPGPVASNIYRDALEPPAGDVGAKAQLQALDSYCATGMTGREVGDVAFDGLEQDKFWLFTHPDMVQEYLSRAQSIVQGINPGAFGGID